MDTTQILTNIIAYAVQIGLLVGIGAALPALLRVKSPGGRLFYWQLLLIACLALPWLRPWRSEVIAFSPTPVALTQAAASIETSAPVHSAVPSIGVIVIWLLIAGMAVRLVGLAVGLLKLARYRRRGRAIPLPPEWTGAVSNTRLLISDDISGPVTFGFFRPVVLLPATFSSMPQAMRDAILFHELLHVERRDWLFTFGEELLRAVFWFHPAIWWVLGEIQLAREQTVDLAVIEMTQARDPYVDTLLAMAGVNVQLDLAPAPLFLRRRHLKQRVMGIIGEVGVQKTKMSKTHLIFAQATALAMMAAACWVVTGAIPLHAQAQMVADAPGVTVNLNGSQLMHRASVPYPGEALARGVEGTVVVQVRLDANGEVIDDAVLSGPDELRKSVQQSVLNWHFDKSEALSTRVVNIDFVKPVTAAGTTRVQVVGIAPAPMAAAPQQSVNVSMPAEQLAQVQENARQAQLRVLDRMTQGIRNEPLAGQRKIESIVINGLSVSARDQLLAQLPVHSGDSWSPELASSAEQVARAFDQHLSTAFAPLPDGNAELRISPTGAALSAPALSAPAGAAKIGGNVMAANLVNSVRPIYPPLAKMARQQGTVKFQATVGKDGTVEDLLLISGPPLLVQSAMDAVKKWTYQPTILNGAPVEVVTTVDVNFSLSDGVPEQQQ